MIRVARFLLGLVALDGRGQQAVDATMADWRHELAVAATLRGRVVVNVRSTLGIGRTLAEVGVSQLSSVAVSGFAVKLIAVVVLATVWSLTTVSAGVNRFFLVTSDFEAWTLVAASLVPQLLVMAPLMVFVAEAIGRRRDVTPVAGTMTWLAGLGLLVGFVVMPASAAYLRYATWRHFANSSVAEPSITALAFGAMGIAATALLVAAAWLMFLFANRVRRVGGVAGWGIGLGAVLVAFLAGVLPPILAAFQVPLSRFDVWVALTLLRPPLMIGAILWATHRLARIETARLASSRKSASDVTVVAP